MKKNEKSITTRYPEDLYTAIKKRAEESGRSFNAEVVYELQQYRSQNRPSQPEHQTHAPVSASVISAEDLDGPELKMEEVWKRYSAE